MNSPAAPYINCPHCTTVFAAPSELPAHGKVRCGVCNGVLEAALHGLYQLPEPAGEVSEETFDLDDQSAFDSGTNESVDRGSLENEPHSEEVESAEKDPVAPSAASPDPEEEFNRATPSTEVVDLAALMAEDDDSSAGDRADSGPFESSLDPAEFSGIVDENDELEATVDLASAFEDQFEGGENEGSEEELEATVDLASAIEDQATRTGDEELEATVNLASAFQVKPDAVDDGDLEESDETWLDIGGEDEWAVADENELADEEFATEAPLFEDSSPVENVEEEAEELEEVSVAAENDQDEPITEVDAALEAVDVEEVILIDEDEELQGEEAQPLPDDDLHSEDLAADQLFAQAGDHQVEDQLEDIDDQQPSSSSTEIDEPVPTAADTADQAEPLNELLDFGPRPLADDVNKDVVEKGGEEGGVEALSEQQKAQILTDDELRPVRASRWWLVIHLAVLVSLVAVIVGQFLYLLREPLKDHPVIRPWQQTLCATLGCELPPRRDTSQLGAVAKVVISHPKYQEALRVDLSLQNRADYAQPFPTIRLLFLDQQDRPVAGRDFAPTEYLTGPLAGKTLLQPLVPEQIVLQIKDPGPQAVNYRFSYH